MDFIDFLSSFGIIGLFTWFLMALTSFSGIILGFVSLIRSLGERKTYPLAFKLLFWTMITTLLTGTMGTMAAYADTFAGLADSTGAAKAEIFKMSMEHANYFLFTGAISAFIQLLFIGISWIIQKSRREKQSNKKFPVILLPALIVSPIVITGFYCSLRSIETILLLKPDSPNPMILGINLGTFINVSLLSAAAGAFFIFLFLIASVFSGNKKQAQN